MNSRLIEFLPCVQKYRKRIQNIAFPKFHSASLTSLVSFLLDENERVGGTLEHVTWAPPSTADIEESRPARYMGSLKASVLPLGFSLAKKTVLQEKVDKVVGKFLS